MTNTHVFVTIHIVLIVACAACVVIGIVGCGPTPEERDTVVPSAERWAEGNLLVFADEFNAALTRTLIGLETFPIGQPVPTVKGGQISVGFGELNQIGFGPNMRVEYNVTADFWYGQAANRVHYTATLPGSVIVNAGDSLMTVVQHTTYLHRLTIERR